MVGVTHQNQRTAAVTGAGSGLGRDIALGLAVKNYLVFGTARRSCSDAVRPCRRFRRRTGVGAGERSKARVGRLCLEIVVTMDPLKERKSRQHPHASPDLRHDLMRFQS